MKALLVIILLLVMGCSEENYCADPYVAYYEPITLWDGSLSYQPIMRCSNEDL